MLVFVSGKQQWGTCKGQQASLTASPATNMHTDIDTIITVAAATATLVNRKVGGVRVELMLDSSSSVSLLQSNALQGASDIQILSSKTNPLSHCIR